MRGKESAGLTIAAAGPAEVEAIVEVIQTSIRTVYPKYYPAEIVRFFRALHNREHVAAAVRAECVWVLLDQGAVVGTGSCSAGHITGVYVLPECQGRGLGSWMMDHLEAVASGEYSRVVLDASLPAVQFYEHRGYKTVYHDVAEAGNGVRLVYDVMEKCLQPAAPAERTAGKRLRRHLQEAL